MQSRQAISDVLPVSRYSRGSSRGAIASRTECNTTPHIKSDHRQKKVLIV